MIQSPPINDRCQTYSYLLGARHTPRPLTPDAISCLGAYRPPDAEASGELRLAGGRKPAHTRLYAVQQDMIAIRHSMISSAATRSASGTVRPSPFAVLRLMTR